MSEPERESAVKPGRLNPMALSATDAARLLTSACGIRIDVEKIVTDIKSGAPTNGDGTINLVHYAAWLVKEMAARAN